MIVVDGSPLVLQSRSGVARALTALLSGWAQAPEDERPLVLRPDPGVSARAFRAGLPARLRDVGARALYSPWSAFPDVAVPVVACVHELPFIRLGPIEGRLRTRRHRLWLARNVRECAAIVVPSEATRADLLLAHPEAAAQLCVVPNGFDPGPWRAAQPLRGVPPYALMVGVGRGHRGARKKGLDLLLAAWLKARPALELVLVGRPGMRVPAGVRVHSAPEDAELERLVAGAHLLVYPSRSEGFGYPPLEAMAAGVPVLATGSGSVPEVVGDAALLVTAGDADALAHGLSRVSEDAALRKTLIAAGRVRANAFPPVQSATALGRVFEELGVRA